MKKLLFLLFFLPLTLIGQNKWVIVFENTAIGHISTEPDGTGSIRGMVRAKVQPDSSFQLFLPEISGQLYLTTYIDLKLLRLEFTKEGQTLIWTTDYPTKAICNTSTVLRFHKGYTLTNRLIFGYPSYYFTVTRQ